MPSEQFEQARRRLDLLESTWISLLLWMGELKGISPETMVLAIPSRGPDLVGNYERRRAQVPTAEFGPLHFVQFPDYLTIAKQYRNELESLGNPQPNWVRVLEQSFQECTTFRNDLQHAARFDQLPPKDRDKALGLFDTQLHALRSWWPDHQPVAQTPVREDNPLVRALQVLGQDEQSAAALAEELGFKPIRNPINLIPAGADTPLARALGDGIGRLYRVGEKNVGGQTAGFYLAYLDQWPERSAQRERYRRRLATALTVHQAQVDPRFLIVMADDSPEPSREIEIVYPRQREGARASTVRATIELDDPTRYHRDLLRDLSLTGATSLREVIRRWNSAFDVERVTGSFFKEFKDLRDHIAEALIASNPGNPALAGHSLAEFKTPYKSATNEQRQFQLNVTAFATRQLSRMLFLWFLQAKGWLGSDTLPGSHSFLIDLFRQRAKDGDSYFSDVLVPLFFDGLGEREHATAHKNVEQTLGALLKNTVYLPYVDGGLFRADADAFERAVFGVDDDGQRTRDIVLPDDLFDPAKDDSNPGKNRQRTVLGLLRSYRFTTQESTPDDQSVDPDPELLGKVFEDLYQSDERHETGAYYTPREIVRYMCREALDGYLRDTTGVEQTTLDRIRLEALDFEAEDLRLTPAEESALTEALDDVTVVDPAVGSGAFLVGMLQEIVQLRRGIEAAATDREIDRTSKAVYEWKRRAITHSLHGVDINPTAVEICRLRLWLSLVIEYDVDFLRDIPALPNLEFRVVAGDSLVDRMGAEPFFQSLPLNESRQRVLEAQPHIAKLDRLRLELDRENVKERPSQRTVTDLQRRMKEEIASICQAELDNQLSIAEGKLKIVAANPKATAKARKDAEAVVAGLRGLEGGLEPNAAFLKPLLWPLVFGHVFDGESPGFDIVVANPPYVWHRHRNEIDAQSHQGAFPLVYSGSADLYVYFIERAIQLLKTGGWVAFITSDKYLRVDYGKGVRSTLPRRLQISTLLDFGDLRIFGVAAYPAVLIGKKVNDPDLSRYIMAADLSRSVKTLVSSEGLSPNSPEDIRTILQDLGNIIRNNAADGLSQSALGSDGWVLEHRGQVDLLNRLMSEGIPLGEYVSGKIYRGIQTGLNDAFVIDEVKRGELIKADSKSAELIRPWLRGKDIRKWSADWKDLYFIFARHGLQIADYPAIQAHLENWREALTPKLPGDPPDKPGRAPGRRKWYEIDAPVAHSADFASPKIIVGEILNAPSFTFDPTGEFHCSTCEIIVSDDIALAALLNSTVVWWILVQICTSRQNGYIKIYTGNLEKIPIPPGFREFQSALSDLARSAGSSGSEVVTRRLHEISVGAYGLSTEEGTLIWEWYTARTNA